MKVTINLVSVILFVAAFCACSGGSNDDTTTVTFEGFDSAVLHKINPLNFQSISLIDDSLKSVHDVEIEQPTMAYIKIEESPIPVYLSPGFKLTIRRNGHQLGFEGDGADINQQLFQYHQLIKSYEQKKSFFELSYPDFLVRIDSLTRDFDQLQSKTESGQPKALMHDFFEALLAWQKMNYALVYYNPYDANADFPPEIQAAVEAVPSLNYLLDLGYHDYIIALHLYQDAFCGVQVWDEAYNENDSLQKLFHTKVFESLPNIIKEPNLVSFFQAHATYRELESRGAGPNFARLMAEFEALYPNSAYAQTIIELREELNALAENIFPDLPFRDLDGNDVRMKSLKGQLIYLDIWATWCQPCIAEFPSSEALRDSLAEQDITFVYLSVDKDTSKWRSFLEQHQELAGVHWNEIESGSVFKELKLDGIPRYMLIDRNGKIINAHASRPSADHIMQEIKSHL
jgi:thiol-disulfide isomerase/thioredoxin